MKCTICQIHMKLKRTLQKLLLLILQVVVQEAQAINGFWC